jgi:uncharacterized RDD family membrane protein YckC
MVVVLAPIVYAIYGPAYLESDALVQGPLDFLLTWVLPAVAVILFWVYKGATPGKMVFRARIIDARTGGRPSTGQLIGRYLGYFLSTIGFLLGYLWVIWDRRRQAWHDKLAKTVVVRRVASAGPESVRFQPEG